MTTPETITTDPRVRAEVSEHPHPLLFATVSGAHLYGFASADSDVDLRGAHVAPVEMLTGLDRVEETVKLSHVREGLEVDLVTHEARKFLSLLLRNNGYVLEQVTSPLVVHTTPAHAELVALARGCVTRACVRHYLGFAQNQWQLFDKERPRRVKPLLYVFRVLLTGIHMMRTGEVNANLLACDDALNAGERLPYVDALVARKVAGGEHGALGDADVSFYAGEYRRLRAWLVEAADRSTLPDAPTSGEAIKDLLRRIRRAASVTA
ncbi:nucleotidyltransferase [Gemmatimonadetes bacterium T265]|nr:nucleotidyltransferase [Gemmatimonadetes bacterium T265]